MIKMKWSTFIKVLKILATIIATAASTLAVQSCNPTLF